MNHWIKLSIGALAVWASVCTGGANAGDCAAPELHGLHDGYPVYHQLVCAGMEHMEMQKFDEAAKAFEEALSVPLHETPNFELLPRLALAYARAGNAQKAQYTLEKARLSLQVFTGVLKCEEDGKDGSSAYLRRAWDGVRISGKASKEIATKMCGIGYEYVYKRASLDRVLREADMVRYYFDVKKEVENNDH